MRAQQDLLVLAAEDDRRVARGIDAARDAGIDLAERDLVRDGDRGLEARAAGALHVESRRLGREPGIEQRLARQVPLARMLHDRAGDDVAEPLPLERELVHDRLQGGGEHFLVADARVSALRPRKGYAGAADDCDAPGL